MTFEQARELSHNNFYFDADVTAETIIEVFHVLFASDDQADAMRASELLLIWPGLAETRTPLGDSAFD